MKEPLTKFFLYTLPHRGEEVNVLVREDSIWMSRQTIISLFDCSEDELLDSIKKTLSEAGFIGGESVKSFTISDAEIIFYRLDLVINIGYKIDTAKARNFRHWATEVLKEFIKKGFVLDDERLKQGERVFGEDYFAELLERVRAIRASERRIWQKITDIFAECSIDYDAKSEVTKEFYATIQNKFHYAIIGQTASEIITKNADHTQKNMGLQTWKNAPTGRILKSDVVIAKNYLQDEQIKRLERLVVSFFDYIEDIIERKETFTMAEFAKSVNAFLEFREYKVLQGKGTISHEQAKTKALAEYAIFAPKQQIESDFDRELLKYLKKVGN